MRRDGRSSSGHRIGAATYQVGSSMDVVWRQLASSHYVGNSTFRMRSGRPKTAHVGWVNQLKSKRCSGRARSFRWQDIAPTFTTRTISTTLRRSRPAIGAAAIRLSAGVAAKGDGAGTGGRRARLKTKEPSTGRVLLPTRGAMGIATHIP